MNQPQTHQRWQCGGGVQEFLKSIQRFPHLRHRRRYKGRIVQRASWRSEPVLTAPELAGGLMLPAYPLHQPGVDLPDQAQAERQRPQPLQAVLQRPHVVVHLTHVRRVVKQGKLHGLIGVEVRERRPRAFNLGGKDGLAVHKGRDQDVGIGQCRPQASQSAQSLVGCGEIGYQFGRPRQAGRQGVGHVSPIIAPGHVHRAARRAILECLRVHSRTSYSHKWI